MERLAFSSAAGLSPFSRMVFVLAVLKILHKPLGWVLLILVTVLGARDLKLAGGEAWCSITQQIGKARFSATWLGHAFILLFLFVVLGVVLISALGPAIEFDGLSYHLTGPKIYVQESERSIGRMRSSFRVSPEPVVQEILGGSQDQNSAQASR